jgi:propionate CoA-transferase
MSVRFVKAAEAAAMIKDGDTLATVGMTLVSSAESIWKAMEASFLASGSPRDLTFVHSAGQCNRDRGNQHLCHEGMVKRVIGGHWGLAPRWMEMIGSNQVEAFNLPQGQIAQLYRSMACGLPGKMSKVGLGTYIDPRIEGGKMNERTRPCPDIIDVMEYGGEEYLFYKSIPLNVVMIRGTTADEMGNITCEEEAMKLEVMPAVLAAKRYGGKVLAQVKRVARTGSLHPKQVVVPGFFVDAIVVCDNPEVDHRQSSSFIYDPSLCGELVTPAAAADPLPLSMRKVIGRRAMMELELGTALNVGTGIPNDVVGSILSEEGLGDDVLLTIESGVYGGVPEGGIDFGVAHNAYALIPHEVQFDFYNGMGIPFTFMGAGEMDEVGHVNATRFGDRAPGCGGFVDITQNAGHVMFCSSFTARGLQVEFAGGKLRIVKEGTQKKLVKKVMQISFNGEIARRNHQKVHFVTERAVFELRPESPVLVEIAPGVDLKRDILEQMEFTPIIARELKTTDASVYNTGRFDLKAKLYAKAKEIAKV